MRTEHEDVFIRSVKVSWDKQSSFHSSSLHERQLEHLAKPLFHESLLLCTSSYDLCFLSSVIEKVITIMESMPVKFSIFVNRLSAEVLFNISVFLPINPLKGL